MRQDAVFVKTNATSYRHGSEFHARNPGSNANRLNVELSDTQECPIQVVFVAVTFKGIVLRLRDKHLLLSHCASFLKKKKEI